MFNEPIQVDYVYNAHNAINKELPESYGNHGD